MPPHSELDKSHPNAGYGNHDGFVMEAPMTDIPVLIVGMQSYVGRSSQQQYEDLYHSIS